MFFFSELFLLLTFLVALDINPCLCTFKNKNAGEIKSHNLFLQAYVILNESINRRSVILGQQIVLVRMN